LNRINDRVLSANGVSLENVTYETAVGVLRDSGPTLHLVVKRRVVLPSTPIDQAQAQTLKLTLTKSRKKDGESSSDDQDLRYLYSNTH
jgi:tight junction protein 1